MSELNITVKIIPSYEEVITLLVEYFKSYENRLNGNQISSINEVKRRLSRLDKLSEELINLNNQLITTNEFFNLNFDPINGFIVNIDGKEHLVKLKRKDPNVPIHMVGQVALSGYSANNKEIESEDDSEIKNEFEEKIESFYQTAHRVLKIVKILPGIVNFKCKEITITRNKLIEHTEERHIYSFGFGSYGPVLKPERPKNEDEFRDQGFTKNSQAFIDSLTIKLKEAISNA